jgi:phosphoglycerate dehydrogenase-like enzyme
MNILFLNKFNDYWKEKFNKLKEEFPDVVFTASYNPDEREAALKNAEAVVTGRMSKKEIEDSLNIKVIFVPFTGLNTFNLDTIKNKNIIISNTHANASTVAEHAVALAFALLGRIVEFHNDLKKGVWHRSIEDKDKWTTIQNKTVGIIGYGHIGNYISRFLQPFGCNIIGFKKHKDSGERQNTRENTVEVSADLDYVINKSDIVFVCLPLNPETKDIINKDVLKNMKDKYLINAGRGETVNEEALYEALKDGVLAGAAIDVWYNYPGKKEEPVYPSAFPIYELPNVVISPHKSSHTNEAINAMIDDTFENIRTYILTGKPGNIVDPD